MTIAKTFAATLIIFIVVICSYDLGVASSPAGTEVDSLVITAKIDGAALDISAPNHVTLPATITFTASMPVTIYYSTSSGDPASSATFAIIDSANGTVAGPTIDSTDYSLFMVGVDAAGSLTPLITYTFTTP
jgi:hypothetical protein